MPPTSTLFNSLRLLAIALRIKVHTLGYLAGVVSTYLTRLIQEHLPPPPAHYSHMSFRF